MLDRPVCPLPISDYPEVLLAHGGGDRGTLVINGTINDLAMKGYDRGSRPRHPTQFFWRHA